MKKVLILFLMLATVLCSCSTFGKKVYYENDDVVIYEPDSVSVDQFNRSSAKVVIKNKKSRTNVLAFFYTYNNGERDLTKLWGIESVRLNPNETKKISLKNMSSNNFGFDEGYKYISIIKDSILVIDYKDVQNFYVKYKKEYEIYNNKEFYADPYKDDLSSSIYLTRYIYSLNPPKIYTAEYLKELYYSDSIFGLYFDVPRVWNRKISDDKCVFYTYDINLEIRKYNKTKNYILNSKEVEEVTLDVVNSLYKENFAITRKKSWPVYKKDLGKYDSFIVEGFFVKQWVKTNIWYRWIERENDWITVSLTEEENQKYLSKVELDSIIEDIFDISHEEYIDEKKQ